MEPLKTRRREGAILELPFLHRLNNSEFAPNEQKYPFRDIDSYPRNKDNIVASLSWCVVAKSCATYRGDFVTPTDIRPSVTALFDMSIAESAFSRVKYITAASNNPLTRRNASETRVNGAKLDEEHIRSGTTQTTEPP